MRFATVTLLASSCTTRSCSVFGGDGVWRDVHFWNVVSNDCIALIQGLPVTELRNATVTWTVELGHCRLLTARANKLQGVDHEHDATFQAAFAQSPIVSVMSARGESGKRAILAALGANLGIAIAKFIGFLITGATSLLAEAVHSLADTTNQGLLLLGNKQSQKDEDDRHPFGYGRTRYFWSFVVALVLFSLGGMFALYEGIHKIGHPEKLEKPAVAIVLLLVAVLLEAFSFWTAIKESRPLKGNQGWFRFIQTARVPELPVLLLEDFGALCGLAIALGAIAMSLITGDPIWDGYGTVAIGLLLLVIAAILIVEMKALLLGESATPEDIEKIASAIEGSPDVTRLIHMRTVHQGPEDVLVAAKIEFVRTLDVVGVSRAINEVEIRIRTAVPIARMIYLEPEIYDPNYTRTSAASRGQVSDQVTN